MISHGFNRIERALLPEGSHFSKEQKEVIMATGNINIVAGPGSGKTTVLTAKLLMLLKQQRKGEKGICCITHTNVAVDEIKERIRQAGGGEIEYPNFIGTIQSFFIHYFGNKAFGLLFPGKKLRIFDGEAYSDLYNKTFLEVVNWWSMTPPSYTRRNARLNISIDGKFNFKNNETKRYGSNINESLMRIFKRGIVNSDQMTVLTEWYIRKYPEKLIDAINERFKYILLDEAQDTSKSQYQLLRKITMENKICFQKFGDPYQALYTIYGNDIEDAWNPRVEEQQGVSQTKEISTTARFGETIANLVRNVCYEEYLTFHSENVSNDVSNNYFIIFQNEDDLRKKYRRLVKQINNSNPSFEGCMKDDKIVAPMHQDLEKWFLEYKKSTANSTTSPYKYILNSVLRRIAYMNRKTIKEVQEDFQKDSQKSSMLSEVIQKLFFRNITKEDLEPLIKNLLGKDVKKNDVLKCSGMIIEDSNIYFSKSIAKCDDIKRNMSISTIHGVKGETHRVTFLLLDSKVNRDSGMHEEENPFFDTLFPFLIGERSDYNSKFTRDCLKYAYVALSRPKYVAGVAIPESSITAEQKERLIHYGWKETK